MKLLSFGEILWDIVNGKEYLGGAPFNLAAHAAKCIDQCNIVSCIGRDQRGRDILAQASKLNIGTQYVRQHPAMPTGAVDALISETGQPDYVIHAPVAYDFIELSDDIIDEIVSSRYDVFCFGSLAQRNDISRNSLLSLLDRLDRSITKVFYDVNLRQQFYSAQILKRSLLACDILKLNDEEVAVMSKLFYDTKMPVQDFCSAISSQFSIDEIVVTMGEKGASIFNCDGFETVAGNAVEVADTIGAGDAFSAAFLYKRLSGSDAIEALQTANRIGAFVASKSGAIPQYSL